MKTPHVQIVAARVARQSADSIIAMRESELNDMSSWCAREPDNVRIYCERMSDIAINIIRASVRFSGGYA